MRRLVILTFVTLLWSCSPNPLAEGMNKKELVETIGEPDSIQIEKGMPNVYTNKIINIEFWYYGLDTSIVLADDKIQTISIKE